MDEQTKRYLLVFDEMLCSGAAQELRTCTRAGAENSPHRHFTAMQVELDQFGIIKSAGVLPDLHSKEVIALYKEAGKQGVYAWAPQDIQERVSGKDAVYNITLKKEYAKNTPPKFYVDLRLGTSTTNFIRALASFPDTNEGYKEARRAMLMHAARENIMYLDQEEANVLRGSIDADLIS